MIHIFIVNPIVGQDGYTQKLRDKLNTIEDIEYYVFSTNAPGHEKELAATVQHIFQGERLRIYVCGGSGTLQNVLCGLKSFEDIEIAEIPIGTNDFIKVFDNYELFSDLEQMIRGEAIPIDYIKVNDMYALNTVSFGIDAELVRVANDLREIGNIFANLNYVMGTFYAMFMCMNQKYKISLDDRIFSGYSAEVIFGNGKVIGGNLYCFDDNNVQDGEGKYMIIPDVQGIERFPYFYALMKKNSKYIKENCLTGESSRLSVERADGKEFVFNLDGDLYRDNCLNIEIVRKGLEFVFPKGVRP